MKSIIPASRALTDFGEGLVLPAGPGAAGAAHGVAQNVAREAAGKKAVKRADEAAAEEEALAARLEQAFQEGLALGRRQAAAEFAEKEARLAREHAAALEACAREWREETGRALARALREGIEGLRREVEEKLADVLRPVVTDAARRMALRQLRERILRLAGEDEGLKIQVRGPADMLRALRGELGAHAAGVSLEPDERAARLCVHVDNTVIETTIEQWARQFQPDAGKDDAA